MQIRDHIFKYTCQHSGQSSNKQFSYICEKIKNPTPEQLLFYYLKEDSILPEELDFLLKNTTPNINEYNRDGDTPIMNALMHIGLSEEEQSMLNTFEKIKILTRYPINYDLINVDGENIYTELLGMSSYKTQKESFQLLKLEKIEELLNLFLEKHAHFNLNIKRSQYNCFDFPAHAAKDDKYHWALNYLIKKGLDVNLVYKDENEDENTLLSFAKQYGAHKNEQLIFENIQESVEKNNFEATIGLATIEKNYKIGKNKL